MTWRYPVNRRRRIGPLLLWFWTAVHEGMDQKIWHWRLGWGPLALDVMCGRYGDWEDEEHPQE